MSEIPKNQQPLLTLKEMRRYPTMAITKEMVRCLRCGSYHNQEAVLIETAEESYFYCPSCIQLGRVQSNGVFYGCPAKQHSKPHKVVFNWHGSLSVSQAQLSEKIVQSVNQQTTLLVHAVTGAGKTEMLFKGILDALKKGQRVCLASPRIDVCLELYPRLQKVFPKTKMALLYGKQQVAYVYAQLVICTTHQLLRFYRAFDVLIVDEVDAFPFVNNQVLSFGVIQSRKEKASLLLLTATPTQESHSQLISEMHTPAVVPVRYHGYELPVPVGKWLNFGGRSRLPKIVQQQLMMKRKTLLFCPTIAAVIQLEKDMQQRFPKNKMASAHAKDQQRHHKIEKMRAHAYDLFITTTILERGVTFENIDVIVVNSQHQLFDKASLIQIAGRVGRHQDYPSGKVLFLHQGWTKAMRGCIAEIKRMNRLATKKGLLRK